MKLTHLIAVVMLMIGIAGLFWVQLFQNQGQLKQLKEETYSQAPSESKPKADVELTDTLQSQVQDLEKSIQASNEQLEKARIELERQTSLLEEIRSIESDFDEGKIDGNEYLRRRRELSAR